MRLKSMQRQLPMWPVDSYDHALMHAAKAVGRLADMGADRDDEFQRYQDQLNAELDAYEATLPKSDEPRGARGTPPASNVTPPRFADRDEVAKFAADLVVCALKIAQACPSGKFDLESAVIARVREKCGAAAFPDAEPAPTSTPPRSG